MILPAARDMRTPLQTAIIAALAIFSVTLQCGTGVCQSLNLPNSGFEDGLENWLAFVPGLCEISLSDDAYAGASSCRISDRQFFWTGLARDLFQITQRDCEYKISVRLKSGTANPATLKIEIRQTDDRGTRFFDLGVKQVSPDHWSHFEGGFNLRVNGTLTELDLKIAGDIGNTSDFLVDDLQIEKITWRDAANAAIENVRKSDLSVSLATESGTTLSNHPFQLQQIRSEFAFGATMNEVVIKNPAYQDFFKQHFEWATIEWRAQWFPTEFNRGTEDYSLADATIAFCEQNNIKLRGHAVAWSSPEFVPPWLPTLSNNEITAELDQRIENAVTHFSGKLASWDVCNEMLAHSFFQDRLGQGIRSHIFRRTRALDPKTPLFTNEFDIITEKHDSRIPMYKALIQQLQSESAEINGIGMQGHFGGNTSVYNIGRAVDELSTLNLPIWISEYDSVNLDRTELAKDLDTVYRYAFSRPEIDGIVMWGFWAGTHWRGNDAALVEQDWEVNAAGQQYLNLRTEWSTNLDTATDNDGQLSTRGFHGTYLLTTNHPITAEPSLHYFPLTSQVQSQSIDISIPDKSGCLSIYGSEGNDEIEISMGDLTRFTMNGQLIPIPSSQSFNRIRIVGGSGNDQLTIHGYSSSPTDYIMLSDRLFTRPAGVNIDYEQMERVELRSERLDDIVRLHDTHLEIDFFVSEPDQSTMTGPNTTRVASNFAVAIGYSNPSEIDSAIFLGGPGIDHVRCDEDVMRVRAPSGGLRYSFDFAVTQMQANDTLDRAIGYSPLGSNSISLSPARVQMTFGGQNYCLTDFAIARIDGAIGNTDVIQITDSETENETVAIAPNSILFLQPNSSTSSIFRTVLRNFNRSDTTFSQSGNDYLRINDSAGNDTATASADSFTLQGDNFQHTCNQADRVRAISGPGGTNQAERLSPNYTMQFLGDWQFN